MVTESNNKNVVYRLRSLDRLLGEEYQELEGQTIYFSPFSKLNDPMEGVFDMVWFGDSVLWKNLFRHFLLCMEHKVSMATIYRPEDSEKFFEDSFPIFISEMELPTDLYRQHFNVIKKRFFSYEPVRAFIEYLGNRELPLRKNQLSTILSLISDFALESILFGHDNSKFQPQPFWGSLQELVTKKELHNKIMNLFKLAESIPEEQVNDLLMATNMTIQELILMEQTKLGESIKKINWHYFRLSFLQEYLEQLPQLVYPNWYSASFMTAFPENSVLWGHYGDSHKGVCLIFKTVTNEKHLNPYLLLKHPREDESGFSPPSQFQLHNIVYSDKKSPTVEFFKRLWTQSARIVVKEWYSDTNGQKSACTSGTNPTEEVRLAYWDTLNKIHTTKTKNWEYENECRILLDNSFYNYTKSKSRILKYDFNELEGIVFGIKTPVYEKVRIIRLVAEKCKEHKRNDFKFYQARFSDGDNTIISDELSLLRFEV